MWEGRRLPEQYRGPDWSVGRSQRVFSSEKLLLFSLGCSHSKIFQVLLVTHSCLQTEQRVVISVIRGRLSAVNRRVNTVVNRCFGARRVKLLECSSQSQ